MSDRKIVGIMDNGEFKEYDNKEPKTIDDYFMEWNQAITDIRSKSIELYNLKETLFDMEQDIIQNTDFKELYGKNNDAIRKVHLKQSLGATYDAKKELEIEIEYLKNRIQFINNFMEFQRSALESGMFGIEGDVQL